MSDCNCLFPSSSSLFPFFFFTAPATPEIYTFPYTTLFRSRHLHRRLERQRHWDRIDAADDQRIAVHANRDDGLVPGLDRKSTRLNSSHRCISYAVFCLKKKKNSGSQTIRK